MSNINMIFVFVSLYFPFRSNATLFGIGLSLTCIAITNKNRLQHTAHHSHNVIDFVGCRIELSGNNLVHVQHSKREAVVAQRPRDRMCFNSKKQAENRNRTEKKGKNFKK